MSRRRCSLTLLALVAGVSVMEAQPPAQPTQTFRTGTDVVFVDVSVRDRGRPVPGLTADDFAVTDNGVPQRIESVETTTVPIDLTLVVDVSGSHHVALPMTPPRSRVLASLQAEAAGVARLLRPEDRLRLLAIDRHVQQIWPLGPAASMPPVERIDVHGLPSLYDALAVALLQPVEPARRHVVLARTKGLDSISSIDARAVRAIAERSDVLLHVVMMETALDNEAALRGFQCGLMGLCWPTRRFWVPFERRLIGPGPVHQLLPDGQALSDAADATGGRLHKTQILAEPTLTGAFRRAFEDFRSSYVLRYTPQGVSAAGWHEIKVRVRGGGAYTVRARPGYGIDERPPAAAPPPVPDAPRTLPELTAAYEAGAYRPVVQALRHADAPERLMRDFEAAGNPWPAMPRREAVFALELAEPGAFSGRDAVRQHTHGLLERFSRFVRHPLEPDDFERQWHFAVLALLEGTLRPGEAEAFVARAIDRFPDEPRFLLSKAIVADQRSVRSAAGVATQAGLPAEQAAHVRQYYETAIAAPETAVEGRIRLAWLLHRRGEQEEALAHLRAAGTERIGEPALAYLRLLFLGHVLGALERPDDAADAYRAALKAWPEAQSARVALMNTLILQRDRDGAERLADQIQTSRSEELDPWWMYWQGQYRLQQHVMARLRGMMVR
jgi:VWFA-related protein